MTDARREQLLKRRAELQERLEQIRRDLGRGLDPDLGEQALQLENRDTLLEIARLAEKELDEINTELATLDQ